MTATSKFRRAQRLAICAALTLGAWACEESERGGATSSAAGAGGGGPGSTSGTLTGIGGGFVQLDGGSGGNPCEVDASADVPDPPAMPCDPTSDAGACELPSSVCANTRWLVYFVNPQCINGLCHWDKKAMACPECVCINGGCLMNMTK